MCFLETLLETLGLGLGFAFLRKTCEIQLCLVLPRGVRIIILMAGECPEGNVHNSRTHIFMACKKTLLQNHKLILLNNHKGGLGENVLGSIGGISEKKTSKGRKCPIFNKIMLTCISSLLTNLHSHIFTHHFRRHASTHLST